MTPESVAQAVEPARWRERGAGAELETTIRSDVMPQVTGTDHRKLAQCYLLLGVCKEATAGKGAGRAMQGHASVLGKCATLAPMLNYKLLNSRLRHPGLSTLHPG